MSVVSEAIRAKAEVYHGKQVCEEQVQRLLNEVGLPNGLLPLADPEECGHVPETGFVWLKQKNKSEHKFEKISKLVSYAAEVTAYVEPNKIKKITGVKARELMIWVTITEISIAKPNAEKITFKSGAGPSRTFPAEAFVIEDVAAKDVAKDDAKDIKQTKTGTGTGTGIGLAAASTLAKEEEEVNNGFTETAAAAAAATEDVKKEANDGFTLGATAAGAKEVKKEVSNGLTATAAAANEMKKEVNSGLTAAAVKEV